MIPLFFSLTLLLSLTGTNPPAPNGDILTSEHHVFQHLGLEITELRVLDRATGQITRQAFDAQGFSVDFDTLRAAEQRLEIAARGKISPELGALMSASDAEEPLPVVFWLAVGNEPAFRQMIHDAVAAGAHPEDARRMARDEAERFFSPKTNAFAEELAARGIESDYVGPCWPIVFATVKNSEIATLAARQDVDLAYYAYPASEPENNYAQPTLRTPTVHRRGNNGGAGAVKVMVQDSGGNVSTSNPYLPSVILLNSGSTDYHATAVAGNICMQNHAFYHGGAPGLTEIYTAEGWGDVAAPAAWDLGMQNGVSFGNCSWWNLSKGSIVFLDRYFDYIIRNFGVLMFKSNGNQGSTSEPYSTSPGNGYNMLCTGCYNDGDSVKWNDDAMASYSSWWNPVEGHEKPEVASPGDDVDTTSTSSPWIYYGFGGTSSASPLTLGTAVLVANRAPGIIVHPQAVKAVIMVSAWHNVEGDATLSDRDGAGGVHAGAADAVARDGQFETGTFTGTSFPYDKQILCFKGDRTRVICLWHSDPNSSYSTDVLKMDLDLTVLDPLGGVVATSASTKNPFEIASFEPTVTGYYTVRLSKQSFLGTTEPYCIAWSSQQDAAGAEISITGTGQIGTNVGFNFFDPYEFNEDYVALASFSTLPSLIDLNDGYILPVAFDGLAKATYNGAWPGFVGTLDANGEASTSATIPNNPTLIGTTIYIAMVVLDPGNIPRDTSEVTSFTIN